MKHDERQRTDPRQSLSRRTFLGRTLGTGVAGWTLAHVPPTAGAAGQRPWQIGCYTRPWANYDYRIAFDAIAEAGFEYVGLMTTKSETRLVISVATKIEEATRVGDEVKQRGLKVASVYGGGIPVDRSLAAGIEGLRTLIDNCAACGATNLLMGGTGDEKLYEPYYKAIAECCDYAAEKGVGISIKPHGGLNATGPQCRKTIEMVNHDNFRIWYDAGNIYYYSDGQLSPVDDAPSVDGLVTGWCIKDYKHPKEVALTPGTGLVDFAAVFAKLKAGGFRGGPLIVECLTPRGDLAETVAEAKKARQFLEELTGQPSPQSGGATRGGELKAGVATVDITPPVGYRMSGYFHERLSEGVLNPLHAKALVLQQGPAHAALVFCDIIGLSPEVSRAARRQAEVRTGIPADNILLAATHSHTGPLYFGALREHFHAQAMATGGKDPCEEVDYTALLADRIVEAIEQARGVAQPIRLEAGITQQQGLSFNRRFHMKDGTVRFNPGVQNPEIVKVAGPIDPDVGIVMLRAADNKAVAGLVNFALHLDTVGGTRYAADYPYYAEQTLRRKLGEDFTLLFGTGTCGDINHIDVTRKERLKTDEIGRTLGQTVLETLTELKTVETPSLAVKREVLPVPLQKFTDEEVAQARRDIHKVGTRELSFLDQVKAYKILAVQGRGGSMIPLEVQVFRLSDNVAVVGLPGEVFVDLGLAIKQASPFATTLVIELCHDAPGYIPTRKAFAEGSYETVNSRVAPGGGEMMAQTAIRLLRELAPTPQGDSWA